jgi:hypothetical protein
MDHLSDSGSFKLAELMAMYGRKVLPEYISADAPTANVGMPPKQASWLFARGAKREYPVDTKQNTWLSTLMFYGSPDNKMPSIEKKAVASRLHNAALFHNISSDVDKLCKQIEVGNASPTVSFTKFAVDQDYFGERVQRFPIGSKATSIAAAKAFVLSATKYPYAWRKSASETLLTAFNDYGVSPSEVGNDGFQYLVKASAAFPRDIEAIKASLALRKHTYKDPYARSTVEKLAKEVCADTNLCKIAEALDVLDRETLSVSIYNEGVCLPEEVCFTGHTALNKRASADIPLNESTTVALEDITLCKAAYSVLPAEVVATLLDDTCGPAIKKAKLSAMMPESKAALIAVLPVKNEAVEQASLNSWLNAVR